MSAARGVRAARTPAELMRATGRALLWCVVAVLLLRGAGDVLATPEREPGPVVQRRAPAAWPDDRARAFAVQFARAYLGFSPRRPEQSTRGVLAFAAPELAGSIVPTSRTAIVIRRRCRTRSSRAWSGSAIGRRW